eukprot:TRINITY_DN5565_c0_g1_i1.p1 TRINITY_DN5565_c0_g1~~TRINITY_DN5565_c0_g1_i1.p1  ORF type:complete len:211 (+),score=32.61 TRINITY_DN5565_c0_g1_i1:179-811(+)
MTKKEKKEQLEAQQKGLDRHNQQIRTLRTVEATCVHAILPNLLLSSQFAAGYKDAMTGVCLEKEYVEKRLRKRGVTGILCVTAVDEVIRFDGVRFCLAKMSDDSSFDLSSVLDDTFQFICSVMDGPVREDREIPDGEEELIGGVCMVHCQMGQSRSAAVVIAFLMRRFGWSFEKACALVKEKREIASTERFGAQLKALEPTLIDAFRRDS